MKLIYLMNSGLEQIKKQKFIHTVLIVAVMICAFFLNYISAVFTMKHVNLSFLESYKNQDMYIVSGYEIRAEADTGADVLRATEKERAELFRELSSNESISLCNIGSHKGTAANCDAQFYIYNETLCENTVFTLSGGIQLSQYDGEYTPIIVTDNHPLLLKYDVGDVVEIEMCFTEVDPETSERIKITETTRAEICGVMKAPYKYFINPASVSSTAYDILNSTDGSAIIIKDFKTQDGSSVTEKWIETLVNPYWYAEITAPKDSEEYKAAYKEIADSLPVTPYSYFIELCRLDYREGTADFIILVIGMVLLIAVGIGSVNIYIGERQMRDFAINFVSGAKWSECAFIDIFRNLVVIVIPAAISAVLSGIYFTNEMKATELKWNFFDIKSILLIVGLMTLLFAVSSMPYIVKLKKTEPITFIRTMNKE